jgi:hypothetical protein
VSPQERVDEINRTLEAIRNGWPFFMAVLKDKVDGLTLQLIANDDEQTRGRIKQLRELMDLPETLTQERDGISAGLADEAPANQADGLSG